MSSFLRESKYRHISVSIDKREFHYEALRIHNAASDNPLLTANSKFLAYVDAAGGGSAVAVLPLSSVGKNHIPVLAPSYQQPLIRGHSQTITDLLFSPFNRCHLVTVSNDGYLKLWNVPENGYVVDTSEALRSFQPLQQGASIKGLSYHPSADNIIAVRGIKEIAIIDFSDCSIIASTALETDIQSCCFSFNGQFLVLTTKDKKLVCLDARTAAMLHNVDAHGNHRSSSVVWLGDSSFCSSFGFTSTMDRELIVFDANNDWNIVYRERVDSSTGCAMPYFDVDANLLVLATKGGASLRIYEFDSSIPKLHPICNAPVGEDGFRGVAVVSKQAYDFNACEVLRVLKLTDSAIVPITVTVPRREKQKIHVDLYPPTVHEAEPALTASQWRDGQNSQPNRVTLITADSEAAAESMDTSPATTDSPPPDETSRLSMKRVSLGSTLKYRHLYGVENTRTNSYYNISPATTTDSANLAANDKFWAVPYRGAGGPVYVSRHDAFGKVETSCNVINGHRLPVLDLAFSPFHDDLLATASDDSTVRLWRLPEEGLTTSISENDALMSLSNHTNSVRCCNFHPVAMNTLATASTDCTVRLFDISAGSELFCHAAMPENAIVSNMSFDYSGSLLAVACKDRIVRVVDPRSASTIAETPASAHGRNLRVTYCSTSSYSMIATACNAASGSRQLALWDPRKMSEAAVVKAVDNAAGALFPMFDEDTGVIMLAGKGDTIIRYYELTHLVATDSVTCNKAGEYQSSREPIAGVCLLPKRMVNVKNVEVCRLLKLTDNAVVPISFILPRAEVLKQYFQDDVFVPTRGKSSSVSANDYATGVAMTGAEVECESLHPVDMKALSDKPAEAAVKPRSMTFRENINKAEEENKQRDAAFSRLQDLALQRSKYHPNPSGGGHGFKVDAAPVHDDDDSDDGWDDA